MVFWLVHGPKKRMEVRKKVPCKNFQDAGRKVLVFVCPFPNFESVLVVVQCYSLTGCLQLFPGPFLSCLPKLVSLFFPGWGWNFKKTHKHTQLNIYETLSPEDALEKQLPRCQLMPSEPRNQNFPSTRRQRVPALRRMRPLQWLVTTSGGSCLQNVLSIWWFSVNCRGILSQTSCLLNEPQTLSFFFPPLWFSSPFGVHGCISVRQCIPQVPGSLSLKIHFCQWISQR